MDVMCFMKNMAIKLHELELCINSFVAHYNGEEVEIQEKVEEDSTKMNTRQMVDIIKTQTKEIADRGLGDKDACPLTFDLESQCDT